MDAETLVLAMLEIAERLHNDPEAKTRALEEILKISSGEAGQDVGPPKVRSSPFEKSVKLKGGFTGASKDKLGRNQCFVQGIHVPCAGRSPIEARQEASKRKTTGGSGGGSSSRVETHSSSSNSKYANTGSGQAYVTVGRPDHLKEQLYARKVYALFSANPPEVEIKQVDQNQALVTPVPPESKPLAQAGTPALENLKKGFILDVFLSNLEVVGRDFTHIMVDPQNTVFRMDVSSCLRFNSDGSDKESFSGEVTELKSFLDPQQSPSTAKAFAGIPPEQVSSQIQALLTKREEILSIFPDDLRPTMEQRLNFLEKNSNSQPEKAA